MRWAGFAAGVLGVLSTVGFARAEPVVSSTGSGSDLPVGSASFPADTTGIAPMKVVLTETPPSAAPMQVEPSGSSATPAVVTPAACVAGNSSDEQAFDDAAAKELRRLTFMRQLSQMHDQENEREFSERLTQYLRKTEFRQALETRHLAPSPFERSHR